MKTEVPTPQRRLSHQPKSSFPVPFTTFPNALLDEIMPKLTDTEWRVLCVIVRQTCGWRHGQTGERQTGERQTGKRRAGTRKKSDWLTHRTLLRRTGRASAAVCRAIESLVAQQLIEVHTEWGMLLPTTYERRRCGTRLYYRLHNNILQSKSLE
jgi:hypothetical protein